MPRIFISYRRDDTGYIAGMLAERLEEVFGKEAVFIDVDAIPLGVDFREYLNQAVAKSDLMLALIGDDWLNVKNTQGSRRLDDPADFVRIEIEAALKQKIPVIPVLLAQANMPLESELPPSLQSLAFRNAAEIRSGRDLNHHIEQLIKGLKVHYAAVMPKSTASSERVEFKPDSTPSSASSETPFVTPQTLIDTTQTQPQPNLPKWLLLLIGTVSLGLLGWGVSFLFDSKTDETKTELQTQMNKTLPPQANALNIQPIIPPATNTLPTQKYPTTPQANTYSYFKPCLTGTRNVIVGSGYDTRAEALMRLKRFRAQYPKYTFKLLKTADPTNAYSNEQSAIVVGHGLDLDTAVRLTNQVRSEGIAADAYVSNQTVESDCVDLSSAISN